MLSLQRTVLVSTSTSTTSTSTTLTIDVGIKQSVQRAAHSAGFEDGAALLCQLLLEGMLCVYSCLASGVACKQVRTESRMDVRA